MAGPATAEITVKKSRFLAYVFPVENEGQAEARLAATRAAHPDARHHVFAWVLGADGSRRRASDDGEPSGTAGRPVLEVITRQDLTYTLVIVVRYFGGILLGAPGLVRAYSEAARAGLAAATIVTRYPHYRFRLEVPYPHYQETLHWLEQLAGRVEETLYGESVTLTVLIPQAQLTAFTAAPLVARGVISLTPLSAEVWA